VGKTCLVDRYLHGRFDGTSRPTVGAAFGAKTVHRNSTVITVGIWDTAGQERFESISKLYYRGAKAALVCFDLTNKASFAKVRFWVDELKAYAPECLIFLVGTKADLVEAGVAREVTEAELTKVCQEAGAVTVKNTSSKTGANIAELFDEVVNEVTDRFQGTKKHTGLRNKPPSRHWIAAPPAPTVSLTRSRWAGWLGCALQRMAQVTSRRSR
jgi:Ras-related protein Rab-24